jgi:uncharacterized protein (DUF58 family)
MIPREILKKIRQIELRTTRLVSETLGGQYHSVFKGQGMNFEEVREYQPGDEVRSIDWNVTARMNHPFVKKFVEERELTLMLVVDLERFGPLRLARPIQTRTGRRNRLGAGLLRHPQQRQSRLDSFHRGSGEIHPAQKGRRHVLRVIREILCFQPAKRGTNFGEALDVLNRWRAATPSSWSFPIFFLSSAAAATRSGRAGGYLAFAHFGAAHLAGACARPIAATMSSPSRWWTASNWNCPRWAGWF